MLNLEDILLWRNIMAIKEISLGLLNELSEKIYNEVARYKFLKMAKAAYGDSAKTVEVESNDEYIEYFSVYDSEMNELEPDFTLPVWNTIAKQEYETSKEFLTQEEVWDAIKENIIKGGQVDMLIKTL